LAPQDPKVASKTELSQWLCMAQNAVNQRNEKPLFDCQTVNTHWVPELRHDCGCADEDDEASEEQTKSRTSSPPPLSTFSDTDSNHESNDRQSQRRRDTIDEPNAGRAPPTVPQNDLGNDAVSIER